MKKFIVIIATAFALAGCVTDNTGVSVATPPQVQVVKVPVVKPWPQPPVINKPDLAINHLSKNASTSDTVKALSVTNAQITTYANKLKSALEVYRNNKLALKRRHRNKIS